MSSPIVIVNGLQQQLGPAGTLSVNVIRNLQTTNVDIGASNDLILGGRGTTITLNQLGNVSLSGFTATSLIGSINELMTSKVGNTGAQSMGGDLTINGGTLRIDALAAGNTQLYFRDEADVNQTLLFWSRGDDAFYIRRYAANGSTIEGQFILTGTTITYNGNTIWHAGNDGAGSGLDADTIDGVDLTSLVQISRTLTAGAGLTGGGTLAADRTFDIGATNASIAVAADGISVAFDDGSGVTQLTDSTTGAVGTALYAARRDHRHGLPAHLINATLAATYAPIGTQIIAGNGLSGGGTLASNRTLDIGATNASISVSTDSIAVGFDDTVDPVQLTDSTTGADGTAVVPSRRDHRHGLPAHLVAATLSSTYAPIGTDIIAGAGLTGGGTLSTSRTLNVAAANTSIVVNADSIQVGFDDTLGPTQLTDSTTGADGTGVQPARVDHRHGLPAHLVAATLDSTYVNVTGDTMSGLLTISLAGKNLDLNVTSGTAHAADILHSGTTTGSSIYARHSPSDPAFFADVDGDTDVGFRTRNAAATTKYASLTPTQLSFAGAAGTIAGAANTGGDGYTLQVTTGAGSTTDGFSGGHLKVTTGVGGTTSEAKLWGGISVDLTGASLTPVSGAYEVALGSSQLFTVGRGSLINNKLTYAPTANQLSIVSSSSSVALSPSGISISTNAAGAGYDFSVVAGASSLASAAGGSLSFAAGSPGSGGTVGGMAISAHATPVTAVAGEINLKSVLDTKFQARSSSAIPLNDATYVNLPGGINSIMMGLSIGATAYNQSAGVKALYEAHCSSFSTTSSGTATVISSGWSESYDRLGSFSQSAGVFTYSGTTKIFKVSVHASISNGGATVTNLRFYKNGSQVGGTAIGSFPAISGGHARMTIEHLVSLADTNTLDVRFYVGTTSGNMTVNPCTIIIEEV